MIKCKDYVIIQTREGLREAIKKAAPGDRIYVASIAFKKPKITRIDHGKKTHQKFL